MKRYLLYLFQIAIISAVPASSMFAQSVLYVDVHSKSVNPDGLSWESAFSDLQEAINVSEPYDSLWVAEGVYIPSVSNPDSARFASFFINKEINIFGGFLPGQTSFNERDFVNNLTILSGNIGDPDSLSDNCFHILWIEFVEDLEINGFTIKDGYADGFYEFEDGGAIYLNGAHNICTPLFQNVIFTNNYARALGGAIHTVGFEGVCSPVFIDVDFIENEALQGGGAVNNDAFRGVCSPYFKNVRFIRNVSKNAGAVRNWGYEGISSPTFLDCQFMDNQARVWGGAIYNRAYRVGSECSPRFINCLFSGNESKERGGGLYNAAQSSGDCLPLFVNCTIAGNKTAPGAQFMRNGGAMYNQSTSANCSPKVTSCIIWGNSDGVGFESAYAEYSHSLVQERSQTNSGNLNGYDMANDPLFVEQIAWMDAPNSNGDYRIRIASPVINLGSNDSLPIDVLTDLDGNPRIVCEVVDMGAYESDHYPNCDTTTAISFNDFDDRKLKVYPSPFRNIVNIEFDVDVEDRLEIRLYNESSKEVYFRVLAAGENKTSLDLSLIPAGTYFLRIKDRKGLSSVIRKLVKL